MGGDSFHMSRFFVKRSDINIAEGTAIIYGDDVNHIKNVLRASAGDMLLLADGEGNEYRVRITGINKHYIMTTIDQTSVSTTEPPIEITLFQGIPKGDKMEMVIQKCVELGIAEIIPVITGRTVVKLDNARDVEAKTQKWRRVCIEASKQCNRGRVPFVSFPLKIDEALDKAKRFSLGFIPYENEKLFGLKQLIESYKKQLIEFYKKDKDYGNEASKNIGSMENPRLTDAEPTRICFFIGPEGGFTDFEVEKVKKEGITPVTLGPRILRTETAGMAVLSILMYELGDMG